MWEEAEREDVQEVFRVEVLGGRKGHDFPGVPANEHDGFPIPRLRFLQVDHIHRNGVPWLKTIGWRLHDALVPLPLDETT